MLLLLTWHHHTWQPKCPLQTLHHHESNFVVHSQLEDRIRERLCVFFTHPPSLPVPLHFLHQYGWRYTSSSPLLSPFVFFVCAFIFVTSPSRRLCQDLRPLLLSFWLLFSSLCSSPEDSWCHELPEVANTSGFSQHPSLPPSFPSLLLSSFHFPHYSILPPWGSQALIIHCNL